MPPPTDPRADVRLPSIEGLRAFEVAARLGSYERAADELALTASAIGKRVATVEALLGTPLLTRRGAALTLTAAGREYLERVRPALELLAALPQHQRQQQRHERLRVVVPPTFGRQVLVPHLADYAQAEPEVELEIVLSIPYLDLRAVDADVEIRHGPVDATAGSADGPLMTDVLVPVVAPRLLAATGALQQPADLARYPLLRTPIDPWVPWFRHAGLDWPEPTHGPKLVDLGLLLEAAAWGQGVALARPSLARGWLETGALVAALPQTLTAHTHYQWVLGTHATPAAARFVQWLRARCQRWAAEAQALISGRA